MKKNIFIFIALLIVTACSNNFSENKTNAEISGKAYITIDFSSARTVLPEFELTKLSNIVLKGSRNGASQEILASFDTVSSINNVGIDVGNWDFTLIAKQGNTSFSGTQTKKIEVGENSLSFTLSVVDFGDVVDVGSVKVSLEFPADAGVVCVKAGLFDVSGKNQVSGFALESVAIGGAKVVYEKENVPVGQYLLKFDFYGDADCKAYINTYKEIVKVASECISTAERSVDNLNEVYQISVKLNGGELVDGVTIPAAYTKNSEKIFLPDVFCVKKKNYYFDGFYKTFDFAGDKITQIISTTESLTLYAKWVRGYYISANEINSLNLKSEKEEITVKVYGELTKSQFTSLAEKIKSLSILVNLDLENTTGLTEIPAFDFAFHSSSSCTSLKTIKLPEGVKNIGWGAFYNCTSLKTIEIPKEVTTIGEDTFYGCTSLTTVEIPEGVTSIGGSAFSGCSSLTAVKIPEGVTSIGSCAFYGCSSLTAVKIPEGVTSIDDRVFYYCSSLTAVEIPEGVTSIGNYAFYYCSSLTAVKIPEGVTSIGDSVFRDCSSLTAVKIPEGVTSIGDSVFRDCSSLTTVKIPSTVTTIDSAAFYQCDSIKNVYYEGTASQWCNIDFDDGMNFLSGINFYCEDELLENVVLDSTVTKIPRYAFYKNENIKTVEISEGVLSISDHAFAGCRALTIIKIPTSVTSIGDSVFRDCSSLTAVKIPEGVTSIGENAFENCTSLTTVEITEGVTTIGKEAFYYCTSLNEIHISQSVKKIGISAFYGYGVKNRKVFYSGTASDWCKIDFSGGSGNPLCYGGTDGLFINGEPVRSVVLNSTVTTIPSFAFQNCSQLETVVISESVSQIGYYAFNNCQSLISAIFPDNSIWLITDKSDFTNGARIDVSIPAQNAKCLTGTDIYRYLYRQ